MGGASTTTRTAVAGAIVLVAGTVSLLFAPVLFGRPRPMVHVGWTGVDDAARRALEARYGLSEPSPLPAGRWAYVPLDTSPARLRALVADPAVASTDGINRASGDLARRPPLTPRRGGWITDAPAWAPRAARAAGIALIAAGVPLLLGAAGSAVLAGVRLRRARRRSRLARQPIGNELGTAAEPATPAPATGATRHAPPGVAPLPYRADIDGLRAVAVLGVVAYHADAALVPGGFAGVDVFFVISGFLITSLLLQSLMRGSFSAGSFYARRIRRLAPSLAVVLLAAWAAGWAWLLSDELAQLGTHIASSAVFVTNFVLWGEAGYFDIAAEQKPLLHLWSLGVEEQFYLVWPALLWLTWGRLRPLTLVATVGLASFLVNVLTVGWAPAAAFYWPTSRFWELALGGVLACLAVGDAFTPASPRRFLRLPATAAARNVCATAGVVTLVTGLVLLRGSAPFPGWWALLPAGGTALLIAAGPEAWINRVLLSRRELVFVGLISYPLYLWHWPILTFARMLAAGPLPAPVTAALVMAAFVLAWASYRFLERPLRHAPSRWVVPGLVAATVAVGALGLAVRIRAAALPARFPAEVQALVDFSYRYDALYRERQCYLMPDQPASALAPECIEATPADRPLLVLWGDSHAAHLYPGLHQLQSTRPFRLAEFTGSRCPPLLDVETPTQPYCQDVNRTVLEQLARLRPQTVLLAARWRLYDLATLDRTVAAVRRATPARVVVIGPVPNWDTRLPRVLFNYFRQHPRQPLPQRLTFGLAGYVWEFEREVRARVEASGAEYVSAMDALCDRDGCLTRVGEGADTLTAWDEAHLTAAGSEYLIAQLGARLLPGP